MNPAVSAKEVFLEAIELKPEARGEFVHRTCGGRPDLKAEIEALLREHEGACAHLEATTVVTTPVQASEAGERIGRYRLLERLGEGGFGTVYLAEQREPVVRLVALKVIKPGMDTRQVIARFESERQALALMDHPNIAKVLDAGASAEGRPYFVMELVNGEPITKFCARQGLGVDDVLRLFVQVCQAVQHAHTKGVIHRDIKPGNVLVSEVDGRATARVIDFGVAKATDRLSAEQTAFTEHRQFIGTPEYMSPEQAAGSRDIDTRTDVYSLGVLLYELLTGSTPFDSSSLRSAGYAEIQRIIAEQDPPKPSTRIATRDTSVAAAAGVARARRLSKTVRGELDWIVMKSLEKDRGRRYGTASGLAEDIQRFLAGSPIDAAPPSVSYKLSKFVRRNRAGVIVAATVGVALSGGLGAALYGLDVAQRDRDTAIAAERAKEAERASAEAATDFMQQMFEVIDPSVARGRDTGVLREMLDEAAKKIEAGALSGSPLAEVVMRIRLADVLLALSLLDRAEQMVAPAVSLLERARPGDLVWREKLVVVQRAIADGRRRFEDKIKLSEELLDLRRRLHGPDHHTVADAMASISDAYFEMGKLKESLAHGLAALEVAERAGDDMTTALVLNQLMATEQARSSLGPAAEYGERSVRMFKQALKGDDHPQLARTLTSLVAVKGLIAGQAGEAETLQREAIAMFRRLYPEGTPALGNAINNLAWLLKAQNKLDDAERAYNEALAIERSFGSDREFSVAQVLINLGQLEAARGNLAKAEQWTREAIESCGRAYPDGHYITGFAYIDLGRVLRETDRFEESIGAYREALTLHRRIMGATHAYCALSLNGIGEAHVRLNRHSEAVQPFREVLDIRKADKPEDPVAAAQLQLALALSGTGRLDDAREAVALSREAVGTRERILKAGDWKISNSRSVAGGAKLAEAKLSSEADRLGKAREAYAELVAAGEEFYAAREAVPAPVRKPLVAAACSRVIAAIELIQSLDRDSALSETLEVWTRLRVDAEAK